MKKILIYNRFENGTGGDKQRLLMVTKAIMGKLDGNAHVGFIIAADSKSDPNVIPTINALQNLAENRNIQTSFFVSRTGRPSKGKGPRQADLNVNIKDESIDYWASSPKSNLKGLVEDYSSLKSFIADDLKLFVISGWVHNMNEHSVHYMKETLKIKEDVSLLLCTSPGKELSESFMIAVTQHYQNENIFTIEPSLLKEHGYPILGLGQELCEGVQSTQAREDWIEAIRGKNSDLADMLTNHKGLVKTDPIAVIYCSKDNPGLKPDSSTHLFLDKITDKNIPLVLIGAENSNKSKWNNLLEKKGFRNIIHVGKLPKYAFLRGLRDAEHSMATGTFSVLETKAIGAYHSQYLSPHHLDSFQAELAMADQNPNLYTTAFANGQARLNQITEKVAEIMSLNLQTSETQSLQTIKKKAAARSPKSPPLSQPSLAHFSFLSVSKKEEIDRPKPPATQTDEESLKNSF